MKTYGSPERCQGCSEPRESEPYIVTWGDEYLNSLHGYEIDPIERVYYCPDCIEDVEGAGLDMAESVMREV